MAGDDKARFGVEARAGGATSRENLFAAAEYRETNAPPPSSISPMTKLLLKCCLAGCLLLGIASARAQVVNPKPVSTPNPGYPDSLTDTGLSGRAEVDITIKTDGSVADAELGMADQRAFGKAAMAAVKEWKFQPATRDGTPIEIRVTIPFIFPAPVDQQVNFFAKRKVFVPAPAAVLSPKDYGSKLKLKKDFTDIYARPVDGKDVDETVQVDFIVAPDGTTLNPTIAGTPPPRICR